MMHWFLLMLEEGGIFASFAERGENGKDQHSLDRKWSRQFDCEQGKLMRYLMPSFTELDMEFSK